MHIQTKNIEQYIQMVIGYRININIKYESKGVIRVQCNVPEFSLLVASWCTYYNCVSRTSYCVSYRTLDEQTVILKLELTGSIGKNVCHAKDNVILSKLFKKQVTSDGKYTKRTFGYIVEIMEFGTLREVGVFKASNKGEALKLYKSLLPKSEVTNVEKESIHGRRDRVHKEQLPRKNYTYIED